MIARPRSDPSKLIDPGYGARKSKTEHRSPAKIKRDAERAEEQHQLELIGRCQAKRDAEKIEAENELEDFRGVARKEIEATKWVDIGLPRDPDSRGVVAWPGEQVATIASKLLGIEIGQVIRRKRGRRIIYIDPGMKPRI